MFQPKYTLTSDLLNNLTTIERLYGQIEALKIPSKLELNLQRHNLIQSAYVSNSIEGNPLSLKEVTNLLLDDRVPVDRDEKEVRNYFDILQSLPEIVEHKIDNAFILALHDQLLTGVRDKIKGQIRNKKVVIGKYAPQGQASLSLEVKHEPPYHDRANIAKSLTELNQWIVNNQNMPAPLKMGIFHHHFVYIHPFVDGNGRVCRLLTVLLFMQHGYKMNKYFVLDDYYDIDRTMYSDKLHTADQGDKTEWLEYFTEGIMFSLQGALARVKEGLFKLKVEERPTNQEKKVLDIIQESKEVTSAQIADKLQVSRQQAHNLLSALIEKGFLDKKGSTKNSYYFLK